ncbi:MAG: hypothetical protein AABZ01_00865 [Gemmatimonadota bacterium]
MASTILAIALLYFLAQRGHRPVYQDPGPASIPLAAGVPGGEVIRDTAFQVVLLGILLTAGLVPAVETGALGRGYRRLSGPFPEPEAPPPVESA